MQSSMIYYWLWLCKPLYKFKILIGFRNVRSFTTANKCKMKFAYLQVNVYMWNRSWAFVNRFLSFCRNTWDLQMWSALVTTCMPEGGDALLWIPLFLQNCPPSPLTDYLCSLCVCSHMYANNFFSSELFGGSRQSQQLLSFDYISSFIQSLHSFWWQGFALYPIGPQSSQQWQSNVLAGWLHRKFVA